MRRRKRHTEGGASVDATRGRGMTYGRRTQRVVERPEAPRSYPCERVEWDYDVLIDGTSAVTQQYWVYDWQPPWPSLGHVSETAVSQQAAGDGQPAPCREMQLTVVNNTPPPSGPWDAIHIDWWDGVTWDTATQGTLEDFQVRYDGRQVASTYAGPSLIGVVARMWIVSAVYVGWKYWAFFKYNPPPLGLVGSTSFPEDWHAACYRTSIPQVGATRLFYWHWEHLEMPFNWQVWMTDEDPLPFYNANWTPTTLYWGMCYHTSHHFPIIHSQERPVVTQHIRYDNVRLKFNPEWSDIGAL